MQQPLEPLLEPAVLIRHPRSNCATRSSTTAVCVMAVLALSASACRSAITAFGIGARGRASAEQFFGALADRHVDIVRNAKYEYARVQLSHGALSPSRVFDDTAAWTGASGQVRILETFGTHADGKYLMSSRRNVPAPAKAADGRHVTTLSMLSDGEFRWDTSVDFALGAVRPADIALVVARLLAAGEGATEQMARADIAATAPRTSAALGLLFTLDSLRPMPLNDGSTIVALSIGIHADGMRARFPALGEYLHKYVDPSRIRFTLSDHTGAPYLEFQSRDRVIAIRVRTRGGQLVALNGPLKPAPDSLLMLVDFTDKVKMFNVGFHDLQLDFVNSARDDAERDWTVTAHKEPHWNLPFLTARLIRSPLRHPFAGEGALFRLGIRAGEGDAPSVLVRQSRLAVQESAILRFLNSLSNTAMDDFGQRVEKEENLWLRELFLGMQEDAKSAISP